jgi:hypothetical protein
MSSELRTPDDFGNTDESGDDDERTTIELEPQGWIVGTVEEIKENVGEYGSDLLILTLENTSLEDVEPGEEVEYYCRTNLEKSLRKKRVRGGDEILVERKDDWTGPHPETGEEITSFQYRVEVA